MKEKISRAWYGLLQFMSQMLYIVLTQGRAYHCDRVPTHGGVLVISNHQSYFDPILVALPICRPFNPMARDTLFRNPLFGALIRSLYAFPVRRGSADMTAVKEAIRRLRQNRIVLMFPEGTRTRDGSILPLQPGVVLIAQRAGVPILPAVIDGAFESWPRRSLLPSPHPISVIYGQPISNDELKKADPQEVIQRLHKEMVALQSEVRQYRKKSVAATGSLLQKRSVSQ